MTLTRNHPDRTRRAWLLVAVVVVSLLHVSVSGGCLRKWRAKRQAAREAARLADVQAIESSADPEGIGPSARSGDGQSDASAAQAQSEPGPFRGVVGLTAEGEPGLEVAVWTCDDTGFAASRVLARYAGRPVPVSALEQAAWRERGLRFVAVPVDEIDALARSTRPMSPVQRQRFGQLTSWSAVVRGPTIRGGALGPGSLVPAGKPRLIARAWLEPDLSTGVVRRVVRIEAGVQIETGRSADLLRDRESLGTVSDDGVLVEGMVASFVADGRDAIVLVGESPAVDWSALPGVTPGVNAAPETGAPERAPGGIGPTPPVVRSLGEWMLSAEGSPPQNGRPGTPPRKVLVVLIPRVEAATLDGVNDSADAARAGGR